ncbi:MAG: rhodanese-like domain-containing protein [Planctomycetota bacterium]
MNRIDGAEELPLEVSVGEVKALLEQSDPVFLVDCREPNEHDYCQIEGACLIPMNETPQRLSELEPYRDKRLVVHCHHGGRSLQVTQWLRAQGFAQVQNMSGGIDAWSLEVDPEIPRY